MASTLLLLLICYLLLGRWGLFLGLGLSLLWNYAMLLHNHKSSIEYFKGQLIQGQDPWNLNEILRLYEDKMRCPQIKLYLCDIPEPLCLISISHWQNPSLLLSENLLNLLTFQETESLLALCVSSIKNRNTFSKYSLDRIALTWISISKFWDRVFQPLNQLNFAKHLCYFIAWIHWKVAFTKSLQTKADLETYKSLSEARSLATALWKIHGALDTLKNPVPSLFLYQSLLGNTGSRRTAFQFILPIEYRLQLLIGYFPI
jgi:hypothetical protein